MAKTTAIVPAAGLGKRMGGNVSKQFLEIGGKPVLIHTLEVLEAAELVDEVVLAVPKTELEMVGELVRNFSIKKVSAVVEGGSERQYSIRNGLESVDSSTDIVLIHDGVRPFVSQDSIYSSIKAAERSGASLVAVPVKDTVKEVENGFVCGTVPREKLWLAQTPQSFRYEILKKAYYWAEEKNFLATDDASLVEAMGGKVEVVLGSYDNIKITTSEDLVFAEAIIAKRRNT